jgi:broad specificity phosphatase PhoE
MPGIHLNAEGQAQAQQLALKLTRLPIAAIYSSPMERALQTAEPIAQKLRLQTIICEDFQEIDFGAWTDHSFEILQNDPQFHHFNSFRSCTPAPGGELMAETQLRMIKGLDKLRQRHPDQTIAVISHGDPIRSVIAWYTGIHLDMMLRIEISLASVSILELDESWVRVSLVNYTGDIRL